MTGLMNQAKELDKANETWWIEVKKIVNVGMTWMEMSNDLMAPIMGKSVLLYLSNCYHIQLHN